MRILLIALEFHTWRAARSLSYCAQLGLKHGLENQNIDYFVITTPWLSQIKKILEGKTFDQIWVELVHTNFDENLLDWLTHLAPVRVGFLLESLDYSQEECAVLPILKNRRFIVEKRIPYMTHILACDEKNAEDFNNRNIKPALWWPQAVPRQYLGTISSKISNTYATFSGALYGERIHWLNSDILKNLLIRQSSSEQNTIYPLLFEMLHGATFIACRTGWIANQKLLDKYINLLCNVRRHCFFLWLKGMHKGCAVVNLPHFVKTYAGRVVEGIAAGRPVISWEIPDRPKNKALFENGSEILLFSKDRPEELASQIQRLTLDKALSQKIVRNAFKKVEAFHTIEKRVEQIIQWIERGRLPIYG